MTSEQNKAIGIFDSGIGGLTVLKAIEEVLPHENLIYLGDTARVPYGNKSRETITRYSIENTNFLIQSGVKVVVVACNTASALAVSELRNKFSVPVLGVIEPGAKAALSVTRSKEIGVIGTESTIASSSYSKAIQAMDSKARVQGLACPLFVPLVEEGWVEEEVTYSVAQKYLTPFFTFIKDNQPHSGVEGEAPSALGGMEGRERPRMRGATRAPIIDTLILGCTHYPLLKEVLAQVMGKKVTLVDSAQETAQAVKQLLIRKNILRTDSSDRQETLFVTDSPERFRKVGQNFLKRSLEGVALTSSVQADAG